MNAPGTISNSRSTRFNSIVWKLLAPTPIPILVLVAKLDTRKEFEAALRLIDKEEFEEAHGLLLKCMKRGPHDQNAKMHNERCREEVIGRQLAI